MLNCHTERRTSTVAILDRHAPVEQLLASCAGPGMLAQKDGVAGGTVIPSDSQGAAAHASTAANPLDEIQCADPASRGDRRGAQVPLKVRYLLLILDSRVVCAREGQAAQFSLWNFSRH